MDLREKMEVTEGPVLITGKAFIEYYRAMMSKYSKYVRKHRELRNKIDVLEVQNTIWETVKEHYINNEGGVNVDHIGYFCHIVRPERKMAISRYKKGIVRAFTNGYIYRHIVLSKFSKDRYFHIYKCVTIDIKNKCKDMMKKGYPYKLFYTEVFVNRPKIFRRKPLKKISYENAQSK